MREDGHHPYQIIILINYYTYYYYYYWYVKARNKLHCSIGNSTTPVSFQRSPISGLIGPPLLDNILVMESNAGARFSF